MLVGTMSSCDFFSHCGFWWCCVPKLTCWHLQISHVVRAWFPSSQGSCPQHRGGRKLPYNWASIEIQRGLGTLGYCLVWLNVKMILPKWDMFCIFLQGGWGDENTKMFQNIASTLDILNQCSWRQHRLISPSSSQQGKIHPLCKEAGRTFRSHSGN